ncbi:hypothetical protein [Nitrosomonas sp. Nm166]|nr:hypothetical protein [Nitrosomonas sp. Nm166]
MSFGQNAITQHFTTTPACLVTEMVSQASGGHYEQLYINRDAEEGGV